MPLPTYDPRDPFNLRSGGQPPPVVPTLPPPVGVTPEQQSNTGTGTTGTPGNTGGQGGGGGGGGRNTQQPYTEPGYGGTHTEPGVIYTPPTPEETRRSTGLPPPNNSERIDAMIQQGYTPEAAIHGYYPGQTIDLSNAPREVQDYARKGWIIGQETITEKRPTLPQPLLLQRLGLAPTGTTTYTTYYMSRPGTQETFEYVYGKGRTDVLTGAAFSKTFMGLGTLGSGLQEWITGDKKVGEAEKQSLMEYSLQTREYGQRYGATGGLIHSIYGSPAVQETVIWAGMEVGAPLLFSGAGKAAGFISSRSTKITDLIGGASNRITRFSETLKPTGKTILDTTIGTGRTLIETSKPILTSTGRAFGKAAGTRLGQATIIGDLYLVTEGPRLAETAHNAPERFGGEFLESAGLWTAMSSSLLRSSKEFKIETQPRATTDYYGGIKRETGVTKKDNIIQDFINRNKQKDYLKSQKIMEQKTINQKLSSRTGIGDEVLPNKKQIDNWTKTTEPNPYYKVKAKETPVTEKTYIIDKNQMITTEDLIGIQQHPETLKWKQTKRLASQRQDDLLIGINKTDESIEVLAVAKKSVPMTESESQEAMKYLSTKGGYDPNKFLRERPPAKLDLTATPTGDISRKLTTETRAIELTGTTDKNEAMKALNIEGYNPKKKKMFGESKVETIEPDWLRSITEGEKPERIITGKNRFHDLFKKQNIKTFLKDTRASIENLGSRTDEILQRRLRRPGYEGPQGAKRKYRFIEEWENRKTSYRKTGANEWDQPGKRNYWNERLGARDFSLGDLGIFSTATISLVTPETDILAGHGEIDTTKKYTGTLTDHTNLFDYLNKTDTTQDTFFDEDTSFDTRSLHATITTQQQKQDTRQDLIIRTDTRYDTTIRTPRRTTTPRPPEPRPPRVPTMPRIPGLPGEQQRERKKHIEGIVTNGYIPEVHEKGRWTRLTNKTLTQREAQNLLANALDQTKAAVGRIKPSKGKLQSLGITLKDYSQLSYKFKQKGDLLIEKKQYRIDSPGEERQITAKGWTANKLKGLRTRTGVSSTNYFGKQPTNIKRTKLKRINRRQHYV